MGDRECSEMWPYPTMKFPTLSVLKGLGWLVEIGEGDWMESQENTQLQLYRGKNEQQKVRK